MPMASSSVRHPNDFYRFIVSCNSQVRLERLKGGAGQVLHELVSQRPGFPQ